jgi:hypothetical protein
MALLRTNPPKNAPTLEERILSDRADAAAYIDAFTMSEIKRMGGGVPFESIRQSITGGVDAPLHCACRNEAR